MKIIAESPVQSERMKDGRTASPKMARLYAGALRSWRSPPPLSGVVVPYEGHTATINGAMRNNFLVDVLKLNGEDF